MAKTNFIQDLTSKEVRAVLDYNPETGFFTWRDRPNIRPSTNARQRGKRAGCNRRDTRRPTDYLCIRINNRLYQAHRLAWLHHYGKWPPGEIDHANCNGLDNRVKNLRLATPTQNNANVKRQRNNTSGFKGVSWNRPCRKWQTHIRIDKRSVYLGLFEDAEEAHAAYRMAAIKHFGEFARW